MVLCKNLLRTTDNSEKQIILKGLECKMRRLDEVIFGSSSAHSQFSVVLDFCRVNF